MDIQLSDLLTLSGMVFTVGAAWYRINVRTDEKIDAARAAASATSAELRADISDMKEKAITRREHEHDMTQVKIEIRAFRDEVRDELKTLNLAITSRFDLMMQGLLDSKVKHYGKEV